jgi:hypothetical protein
MPSEILLNWSFKPEEIKTLAQEIIQRSKKVLDDVAALPMDKASFQSVIVPLAHSEGSIPNLFPCFYI